MPYISVKLYPRSKEEKIALAEKLNDLIIDSLGCKPEAVTIAIDDVAPERWQEDIREGVINANRDTLNILIDGGKKTWEV